MRSSSFAMRKRLRGAAAVAGAASRPSFVVVVGQLGPSPKLLLPPPPQLFVPLPPFFGAIRSSRRVMRRRLRGAAFEAVASLRSSFDFMAGLLGFGPNAASAAFTRE